MPSNFAHYLFGQQVLAKLPDYLQKMIRPNLSLYQIGQHGPDIIFYYRPFLPHSVSRVGFQMHKFPARYFFSQARDTVALQQDPRLLAYTLGFLCHFILDSNCHGYIYPKLKTSRVSHVEMETEFDRMLMVQQQIDPLNTNATDHLPVDMELCQLMAQIFVPLTPEQIYYGLRSMKFYHRLLVSPSPSKRYTIRRILRLTHTEHLLGGLIVNPVPNPLCQESNQKLMELYQLSLEEAVNVMIEYYSGFYTGEPLSERFDHTFQS